MTARLNFESGFRAMLDELLPWTRCEERIDRAAAEVYGDAQAAPTSDGLCCAHMTEHLKPCNDHGFECQEIVVARLRSGEIGLVWSEADSVQVLRALDEGDNPDIPGVSDEQRNQNTAFAAAASPDVVLQLVAETRTLRHERDALSNAIAEAAQEAGIYNGDVPLTGPQLIHLAGAVGRLCKSLSRKTQPLPEERT